MSLSRFEAFRDAVFAIAITLLVLNFHVPDLSHATRSESTLRLLDLWPQLLGKRLLTAVLRTGYRSR